MGFLCLTCQGFNTIEEDIVFLFSNYLEINLNLKINSSVSIKNKTPQIKGISRSYLAHRFDVFSIYSVKNSEDEEETVSRLLVVDTNVYSKMFAIQFGR